VLRALPVEGQEILMTELEAHGSQGDVDVALTQNSTVRTRVIGVAVGAALATLCIGAAMRFQRPSPAEALPNPNIQVQGQAVVIAPGAPQWQVLKLGEAKASAERWTDPVAASVRVDEANAARVGSPLGGRVQRVLVQLGEPVHAGQSLFSVASPDLAELTDAEMQARVDLQMAKQQADRVAALIEARAIPAKDGLTSQSELARAEIRHSLSVSKLRALRVGSSSDNEFVVKAPRAGTVVAKNVLPGQEVGASSDSNLITIADLSTVWVVAELFESNASGIKPGTPVRVHLASEPDLQLEGKVDRVSEVVDPERHTLPVRVTFANPERRLKPNTFARMQFLSAPTSGAVEIAAGALVTDGEQQAVFVRDESGAFTRRNVVAGTVRQGRVIVFSGLKSGETVVESGAVLLDNQVALSR
jgi:membrane fusion protein, heavy metal efflux system